MNNIPRIGDKIINHKIVRKTNANSQANIPSPTPDAEPSATANDTAESAVQTQEKEYSLEQFRKDYKHILRREVFPKLKPLEQERQEIFKMLLLLGLPLTAIITIGLFILCMKMQDYRFILIPVGIFIWIWHFQKKKLENKVKNNMMPLLMTAIPGFSWTLDCIIPEDEVWNAELFPYHSGTNVKTDDNFQGAYRGVDIAITESKYTYTTSSGKNRRIVIVFSGAIVKICMNKKFEGTTIIRPKTSANNIWKLLFTDIDLGKPFRDSINNKKMEEIKLEDVDFNKNFSVYSTDQIESRYLLTTSFIDRFKDIMKAFNTDKIFCSFYDNYVYIAPWSSKDLFSLAHLSKTLIDEEQYDVLFREFASILALVDHFKLDKKLGL